MEIELRHVSKSYGANRVVRDISLTIRKGELFFLLGPSGCGKTTLLRMIAGLLHPDEGSILFDGKDVTHLPAEKRKTPMVFQGYALWPHLSIYENVAYGLRVQKLNTEEIDRRTREALKKVRMEGLEDRSPGQLSGGQQQRVAIARALATNPSVLLFDEPLSNLDTHLRSSMRQEIRDIHQTHPFTGVYVTHDQEEAMTLASRIAVMESGIIHQIDTPFEIHRHPAVPWVADFMGTMNWMTVQILETPGKDFQLLTPLGILTLPAPSSLKTQKGELRAGFRPHAARLHEEEDGTGVICRILQAQFTGHSQHLRLKLPEHNLEFQVTEWHPPRIRKEGEPVRLEVEARDLVLFPKI